MSVHVASWAWEQRVGSPGAKLVLLKLADNANDKGIAWPHQKTIADECECDVKTVQRSITKLKELGLVQVVRDHERPGNPNVYRLPWVRRQIVASGGHGVASLGDAKSLPIEREPSIEPEADETSCPQCGVKPPKNTTLTEHLENVHGVRAA